MSKAVDLLLKKLGGLAPKTALVLGSGLGGLVEEVEERGPHSLCRSAGLP